MIFHVIYLMLFVFKCKYVNIYIYSFALYICLIVCIQISGVSLFPLLHELHEKIRSIFQSHIEGMTRQQSTTIHDDIKSAIQNTTTTTTTTTSSSSSLRMNFHLYRTNKICAGTPVPIRNLTRVTEISFTIVRNAKGEPQVGCPFFFMNQV